jgi:hypothetical protein
MKRRRGEEKRWVGRILLEILQPPDRPMSCYGRTTR